MISIYGFYCGFFHLFCLPGLWVFIYFVYPSCKKKGSIIILGVLNNYLHRRDLNWLKNLIQQIEKISGFCFFKSPTRRYQQPEDPTHRKRKRKKKNGATPSIWFIMAQATTNLCRVYRRNRTTVDHVSINKVEWFLNYNGRIVFILGNILIKV